jgi:hypothetical protein
VPDSERARHRVGALLREPAFQGHIERLAAYVSRDLGIPIPGDGKVPSCWHQFIRECRTADFLDTVTVVYRYLFWHVSEPTANWWRQSVRKIFGDENLTYEVDDVGGVHPRVDQEFQRNMAAAIAGLQSDRYQDVCHLLARVAGNLNAEPPNYKLAWQATWSAVEALFGLMFPNVRLTAHEIEHRMPILIERAYQGDPAAQRAGRSMMIALQEWVEASNIYRRQPGGAECAPPPADLAILSISSGASLLRWLVGLDKAQAV